MKIWMYLKCNINKCKVYINYWIIEKKTKLRVSSFALNLQGIFPNPTGQSLTFT